MILLKYRKNIFFNLELYLPVAVAGLLNNLTFCVKLLILTLFVVSFESKSFPNVRDAILLH